MARIECSGTGKLEPVPRSDDQSSATEALKQHCNTLPACHFYHTHTPKETTMAELDRVADLDLPTPCGPELASALALFQRLDLTMGQCAWFGIAQQPDDSSRAVDGAP